MSVDASKRLSYGEPIYNGYFDSPKPLDGKAGNEESRRRLETIFKGLRSGQAVPVDTFVYSHLDATDYMSLLKSLVLLKTRELRVRLTSLISTPITSFVFSGEHRERLLPEYDRYARYIVERLAERISPPVTNDLQ